MGKKSTAERGQSKKAAQKARVRKAEANKLAAENKKADRAAKREAKKEKARKRGKQTKDEDAEFDAQCALLGVRVNVVKGDGNCMFRSIADQLEGNPTKHAEYRAAIMQYIYDRREDFEPFMEDDEKFDAYIARMGRDGEWGGHQELFAASQHYNCNFVIHQLAAPRFEIHAPIPSLARATLHMSYHGEMHYNSVRAADDFTTMAPAQPIKLLTPSGSGAGGSGQGAGGGVLGTADEPEQSEEEKLVTLSCPDATPEQIRSVLRDVAGDAEAAIELLIGGYVGDIAEPADSPVDAHGGDEGGEGGGEATRTGGGRGVGEGGGAEDAAAGAGTQAQAQAQAHGNDHVAGGGSCEAGEGATTDAGDPTDPASIRKKEREKERERGAAKRGAKRGSHSPPPGSDQNPKPRRGGDCPCGSGIKYKKCCRKKDLAKSKAADAGVREPAPDTSGDRKSVV